MEWHAIVGDNIRRLREARDWTIEELAHLASIDVSYLGKIELGKKNPTLKKLQPFQWRLVWILVTSFADGHLTAPCIEIVDRDYSP